MSRSPADRLRRRRRRRRSGQALVELAVLIPVLLFALMGIVEFGNALSIVHAMAGYSREGANIAARGAPLDVVLEVLTEQGAEIKLDEKGGLVATRLEIEHGLPIVKEQVATPGWGARTRVGLPDSTAVNLSDLGLIDSQSYWVVEVFYDYEPVGPLSTVFELVAPNTLYRWSLF